MTELAKSFIAAADDTAPEDAVVQLSTHFTVDEARGPVVSASLRYTALGVVEAYINDRVTSPAVLTPGWTSYEWRVRVAEDDVLDLLGPVNRLDLRLANGWFSGRLGWNGHRGLYGRRPSAAANLTLTFADGTTQLVSTGDNWFCSETATTQADLYDGQAIDARRRATERRAAVTSIDIGEVRLDEYLGPRIERIGSIDPVGVFRSPSGALLVDFGENVVGWTQLRVHGSEGHVVTLRHAEVLEQGELGTRPLRSAKATDTYTLSGSDDVFEPTFTFHGFQFVQVDGWPGTDEELEVSIAAIRVGSPMRRTGTFESSSELLNRFHGNVIRGLLGNFVGIPTDCPQRDERLGWTGDIAVFAPTAGFLFDVRAFLGDWLVDVAEETRHADGIVPYVVPNPLKLEPNAVGNLVLGSPDPTAFWGDAAVWVPWALYQQDGDLAQLESNYHLMALHGNAVERSLDDDGIWRRGFQFGDWLDPTAPPNDPAAAATPTHLVATVAGARTFSLLAETATLLKDAESAQRYRDLATRLRRGFRRAYVEAGALTPETVTGYTLAIVFGMFDEAELESAGERLAGLVRESDYTIVTGFAGTPYVNDALTLTGQNEAAYRLLLQEKCPSWLYAVNMGATTVWERWDSMLPDGTINPGEMTSFNHYALGSVADWLHRVVGGISPAEPGYGRVLIAPTPGPGLDWCDTSLDIPAGRVRVQWKLEGDEFVVTVELPVPGVIRLPGAEETTVGPGTHTLCVPRGSVFARGGAPRNLSVLSGENGEVK